MDKVNNRKKKIIFQNNFFLKSIPDKREHENKYRNILFNYNTKISNHNHHTTKSQSILKFNKNFDDKTLNENNDIDENIEKRKNIEKKLATIDLFEKNTENIYDWNILLNYPKSKLYYNKKEYKSLEEKINENENEPNIDLPKYPVILVDLNDKQIKRFFGKKAMVEGRNDKQSFLVKKKNSTSPKYSRHSVSINDESKTEKNYQKRTLTQSNNKTKKDTKNSISHNIRPISIYWDRRPEETFYFSNAFSDYYNEDLKTFSQKMPILKAKVITSNKRLKKEIIKQRIKLSKEEKKLSDILTKDNIVFRKQDLIIAGERKNAEPLLKNIYYQLNPHLKKKKKHVKMNYHTMKQLQNRKGNLNIIKKGILKPNLEEINMREKKEKQKHYNSVGTSIDNQDFINHNKFNNEIKCHSSRIILSYYDINDPDIKYFNYLLSKYNNRTLNTTEAKDNFYDSINDDDKIKEKTYFSTVKNKKEGKNIKFDGVNKRVFKFPFIIEKYKQYTEGNDKGDKNNKKINKNQKYFITEENENIIYSS